MRVSISRPAWAAEQDPATNKQIQPPIWASSGLRKQHKGVTVYPGSGFQFVVCRGCISEPIVKLTVTVGGHGGPELFMIVKRQRGHGYKMESRATYTHRDTSPVTWILQVGNPPPIARPANVLFNALQIQTITRPQSRSRRPPSAYAHPQGCPRARDGCGGRSVVDQ